MSVSTLEQARAAKKRAATVFKSFGSVAGIGLTRTEQGYGLKINLESRSKPAGVLPAEVDGVPVRVEVVGRISKQKIGKVRTRIASAP